MRAIAPTLALLGGTPALVGVPAPQWPPRSAETGRKLNELYESGNWAFGMTNDLDSFCEEFARAHDCRHGVFMVNGTVTLMIALAASGIGPGDEVIVPAYTWLATASAVKHVGAKIVFVDVEPTTLCLDATLLEAAITSRTRAIIPVHFMGSMTDIDALMAVADRHDLIVIEDCAQAHGSRWNGRAVGSFGHIASFSFQHNKIMSCGEGGICITNDAAVAERLYRAAYIGYAPGESFGNFKSPPPVGLTCYNFRGTQFNAVILRQQLAELRGRVATYWVNARRLQKRIAQIPGVRLQAPGRLADPQSYYKIAFIFDGTPLERVPIDMLRRALIAEGVPVIRSYGAVPDHLLFNLEEGKDYSLPAEGIAVSRKIGGDRVVMLAHQWLGSSAETLERIADAVEKVAAGAEALCARAS